MKLTETVISREQNETSAGAPSAIQTAQVHLQDVRQISIAELSKEEMEAVAGGVSRGFGAKIVYIEMG
jgi:hypothetical protein